MSAEQLLDSEQTLGPEHRGKIQNELDVFLHAGGIEPVKEDKTSAPEIVPALSFPTKTEATSSMLGGRAVPLRFGVPPTPIVESMADADSRHIAQIKTYIDQGQFDEAVLEAGKIQTPGERDYVYILIAWAEASENHFSSASKLLYQVADFNAPRNKEIFGQLLDSLMGATEGLNGEAKVKRYDEIQNIILSAGSFSDEEKYLELIQQAIEAVQKETKHGTLDEKMQAISSVQGSAEMTTEAQVKAEEVVPHAIPAVGLAENTVKEKKDVSPSPTIPEKIEEPVVVEKLLEDTRAEYARELVLWKRANRAQRSFLQKIHQELLGGQRPVPEKERPASLKRTQVAYGEAKEVALARGTDLVSKTLESESEQSEFIKALIVAWRELDPEDADKHESRLEKAEAIWDTVTPRQSGVKFRVNNSLLAESASFGTVAVTGAPQFTGLRVVRGMTAPRAQAIESSVAPIMLAPEIKEIELPIQEVSPKIEDVNIERFPGLDSVATESPVLDDTHIETEPQRVAKVPGEVVPALPIDAEDNSESIPTLHASIPTTQSGAENTATIQPENPLVSVVPTVPTEMRAPEKDTVEMPAPEIIPPVPVFSGIFDAKPMEIVREGEMTHMFYGGELVAEGKGDKVSVLDTWKTSWWETDSDQERAVKYANNELKKLQKK